MTIKTAYLERTLPENGASIRYWDYYNDSRVSRFPNGKVNTSVANPHILNEDWLYKVKMWTNRPGTWTQPNAASTSRSTQFPPGFDINRLDNVVNAKFNGKLRKGSAALGVTLASWKQSREMVVKRAIGVNKVMDVQLSKSYLPNQIKRIRKNREPLADEVLEYKFGWQPLFEDIYNVANIMTNDIPAQWVKARHRSIDEVVVVDNQTYTSTRNRWIVNQWTTYGARVTLTNENLWLANRLGLINPAVVAWDLVPWSFVVNMFVNVNQMLSSITDECGLTVDERNITRSAKVILAQNFLNRIFGTGQELGYDSEYLFKTKRRVLGASPTLRWQARIPEVDWGLAVTAWSLATQKVTKLNKKILGL